MDITPYIRELVVLNECVILRGFGGFDTSYKHAEYDDRNKKILPPGKEIRFRPDWVKDNGMLEEHISRSLDISRGEASKMIDTYVEDLHQKLETKGALELEGIGQFSLDNDRNIFFQTPKDVNFLADSFGLDALDVELRAVETIASITVKPEPLKAIPLFKRKYTGWYIVIGTLLLLILVSFMIYLSGTHGITLFSGKSVSRNGSDMVVFGPDPADTDKTIQEISKALDEKTTVKEALSLDSEPLQLNQDVHYILVAGTFKKEKNAKVLRDKLIKQGFAANIMNTGKVIRVTMGQFSDKKDALDELQRIRGQLNQQIWVMEKH